LNSTCWCNSSFYCQNNTCTLCPENHYCPGLNLSSEAIECPQGKKSSQGSSVITNCSNSSSNNNSRGCTYLPPLAHFLEDCKWACADGYRRIGDYHKNGYCERCAFHGPCDNLGEYVSYDRTCGIEEEGQSDHLCLPCNKTNIAGRAIFTSYNNCSQWECAKGYFLDAAQGKCVPCSSSTQKICAPGYRLTSCTPYSDSECVPCDGDGGDVVGGFIAANTCELVCHKGWKKLNISTRRSKCCSDNSYIVMMNNGTSADCVCSAGLRTGSVIGSDCLF
jgi:hypothetical protein